MKFDFNKEFSFGQIAGIIKTKLNVFTAFVKKMDAGSIKNINVNNRPIRVNALRLGFFAAVLALLLALFINTVIMPSTVYRALSGIEFDTGGEYASYPFDGDILLVNKSGMRRVNNKGESKWELKMTLTCPTLDTANDDYILLTDLDGSNSMTLYNKKGESVCEYPITTDIMAADVSDKGTVVAAVSEEGYKGAVVVYDKHGNEIFKWNSGEGYITDAAISDNGRLVAAAQVMTDGDSTYSVIHIINVSSGREYKYVCENSLAAKLVFGERNNVIAVCDSSVFCVSKKGELKYEIDLAGKTPSEFDVENGNYMIFLCRDTRGNSTLEIYGLSGNLLGTYTDTDEITNIAAYRNSIVVSTSRRVMCLSRHGKVKKTSEISHDIMTIGVFGNNRNCLVLGGNTADIVRIK